MGKTPAKQEAEQRKKELRRKATGAWKDAKQSWNRVSRCASDLSRLHQEQNDVRSTAASLRASVQEVQLRISHLNREEASLKRELSLLEAEFSSGAHPRENTDAIREKIGVTSNQIQSLEARLRQAEGELLEEQAAAARTEDTLVAIGERLQTARQDKIELRDKAKSLERDSRRASLWGWYVHWSGLHVMYWVFAAAFTLALTVWSMEEIFNEPTSTRTEASVRFVGSFLFALVPGAIAGYLAALVASPLGALVRVLLRDRS